VQRGLKIFYKSPSRMANFREAQTCTPWRFRFKTYSLE
jgi:hypothetical protein